MRRGRLEACRWRGSGDVVHSPICTLTVTAQLTWAISPAICRRRLSSWKVVLSTMLMNGEEAIRGRSDIRKVKSLS